MTRPSTDTDAIALAEPIGRSEGYLLSSLDLRAGLEVDVVAAAGLPADVLRELQRLDSWWLGDGYVLSA